MSRGDTGLLLDEDGLLKRVRMKIVQALQLAAFRSWHSLARLFREFRSWADASAPGGTTVSSLNDCKARLTELFQGKLPQDYDSY